MDLANYNATKTYDYDATNRMVGGKNEKGEASQYAYNGMGALVSHTSTTHQNGVAQTVKTDYVIDYTSAAQLELASFGSNGIDTKYTYGIGLNKVSATVNNRHTGNKTRLNIQTDRLGSGRQATDATGQVVAHTMLDEWGMVLEKVTPTVGGVEVDVIGNFTNHEWDSVLDVYYAKARFYDPNTMRFMAADQYKGNVLNPQSLNPYIYTLNNPVNYIDPDGNKPYSTERYDGQYSLYVSSQMLDVAETGTGIAYGVYHPYAGAAYVVLRPGINLLMGQSEINYEIYKDTIGAASNITTELAKNKVVKGLARGTGIAIDALNISEHAYNLIISQKYRIEEAIYNHFDYKVWNSNSRFLVGMKFEYAMDTMVYYIALGLIEVKKAGDVFGEDYFSPFYSHGLITYQYDPLTGEMKHFFKDNYYFFATDDIANGLITKVEDNIENRRLARHNISPTQPEPQTQVPQAQIGPGTFVDMEYVQTGPGVWDWKVPESTMNHYYPNR